MNSVLLWLMLSPTSRSARAGKASEHVSEAGMAITRAWVETHTRPLHLPRNSASCLRQLLLSTCRLHSDCKHRFYICAFCICDLTFDSHLHLNNDTFLCVASSTSHRYSSIHHTQDGASHHRARRPDGTNPRHGIGCLQLPCSSHGQAQHTCEGYGRHQTGGYR